MKVLIKSLAWVFAILFLILGAAMFFLTSVVKSQWFKEQISRYTSEYLGEEMSLEGDFEASFFPSLGVKAKNIKLTNPPEFGDEPLLTANYIVISAKLMPLLQRQFEVDKIILNGANIAYLDDSGRKNYALRNLNLKTGTYIPKEPFQLQGEFDLWQQNEFVTHATIKAVVNFASGFLDIKNLSLKTDKIDLSGNFYSKKFPITSEFAGQLRYKNYQLNDLRTQIVYRNQQLTLKNFTANIVSGNITGAIGANVSLNEKGIGSANIAINNGMITGTDLDYKVDQTIVQYTQREPRVADTGNTHFTSLTTNATINNGVLTTNDLLFLTPTIRVAGAGNYHFATQDINLNLNCRLLHQDEIHMELFGLKLNTDLALYDLPAIVGCKIDSPCVQINLNALLSDIAKRQGEKLAEKAVKEELVEKVIKSDKVKDAVNKLLNF